MKYVKNKEGAVIPVRDELVNDYVGTGEWSLTDKKAYDDTFKEPVTQPNDDTSKKNKI